MSRPKAKRNNKLVLQLIILQITCMILQKDFQKVNNIIIAKFTLIIGLTTTLAKVRKHEVVR